MDDENADNTPNVNFQHPASLITIEFSFPYIVSARKKKQQQNINLKVIAVGYIKINKDGRRIEIDGLLCFSQNLLILIVLWKKHQESCSSDNWAQWT